jgi:hypothetical protein
MKPVIYLLLIGCLTSCYKVKCLNPSISFAFENYDSASLSVIKMEKYEHGSNYSKLQAVTTGNIYATEDKHDTLTYWNICSRIDLNSDYIIRMPATGQIFEIKDFSVQQEKQQISIFGSVTDNCSNTIHYTVNDTARSLRGAAQSSDDPGSVHVSLYR